MSAAQSFRNDFTLSLYMTSVVFVLSHLFQTVAMGVVSQRALTIDPTLVFYLLVSGFLEGLVFFVMGWPVAYLPVYLMSRLRSVSGRRMLAVCVFVGIVLGLISLPLCAFVPFFVLRSPPTYLARCIEYAYPMTIAGAIGGYAFWRFSRRTAQFSELVAEQFS
jgi:hypothetical protein